MFSLSAFLQTVYQRAKGPALQGFSSQIHIDAALKLQFHSISRDSHRFAFPFLTNVILSSRVDSRWKWGAFIASLYISNLPVVDGEVR